MSKQSSIFSVVSGLCHIQVVTHRQQISSCKIIRRNFIAFSRHIYCQLEVTEVLETQNCRRGMC